MRPFHVIIQAQHSDRTGVRGDIAFDDYKIGRCRTSKGNLYHLKGSAIVNNIETKHVVNLNFIILCSISSITSWQSQDENLLLIFSISEYIG